MDQEEITTNGASGIAPAEQEIALLTRELDALQKEMTVSLEARRIAEITEKLNQE